MKIGQANVKLSSIIPIIEFISYVGTTLKDGKIDKAERKQVLRKLAKLVTKILNKSERK